MIDLAALQMAGTTVPTAEIPTPPPSTLKTVGDVGITLGAVKAAGMVGRRAVMGHFLRDGVDADVARRERDPRAIIVLAAAYAIGATLTTAAVYLASTLSLALAWAGVCAFVAAVLALQAARDATPVDDVRLLAEAHRK